MYFQRDEQKLLISIDTPGSSINRKIVTDFEISIPRKKFKLGIISPFKTIILDGNLQQMEQLQDYATKLQLIIDKEVYILDGILKVKRKLCAFLLSLFFSFLMVLSSPINSILKIYT